jgi:hypothetical protein
MKCRRKIALILLSFVATVSSSQSTTGSSTPEAAPQVRPALPQQQVPESEKQDSGSLGKAQLDEGKKQAQAQEKERLARETQARGYWIDPSTKLMWAGTDNGKDVTWGQARKYCRDLRLAGYSDWRLATLDELETLVDRSTNAPERVGNTEYVLIAVGGDRDVRGSVHLTGDSWSGNRELDRFGHPYGPGWFFDFRTSKPSYDLQLLRNTKRVLCVRRSGE